MFDYKFSIYKSAPTKREVIKKKWIFFKKVEVIWERNHTYFGSFYELLLYIYLNTDSGKSKRAYIFWNENNKEKCVEFSVSRGNNKVGIQCSPSDKYRDVISLFHSLDIKDKDIINIWGEDILVRISLYGQSLNSFGTKEDALKKTRVWE